MFSPRRLVPFVLVALFALGLSACGGEAAKEAPHKTVEDRFPIKIGDQVVQMQLALQAEEQQRGLMFRKTMGEDEGMLFVFAAPQPQYFYMRNTVLPLDIGYCDSAGELKEIYPMYPLDEHTVGSRSHGIQFCLEMNQGWFARHGVKPGAKLDLTAVADGVRARGFKPELAGLK
jgi:uncharacterized membrane protein (UPF0127 family)